MGSINNLNARQQHLFDLFPGPGQDVSIEVLYREFFDCVPDPHVARRTMQQSLGPWIKAVNDKSPIWKIVPGRARGTYCLKG